MTLFGEELRRLRRGTGLSQESLAWRASLSPEAVSLLERGRRSPRMTTLRLLADALDLDETQRAAFLATISLPEPSRIPMPVFSDRLIGRAEEVAALVAALDRPGTALVTVLGAGGVGKTRVAVAAAESARRLFPGGSYWLPVRTVREPQNLLPLLAGAIGVRGESGRGLDDLVELLRHPHALLLIDSPEELAAECYPICEALLTRCEHIKIVLASRHLSGIPGEVALTVSPLTIPPVDASVAQLRRTPASELLLTRVGLHRDLTGPERAAVARICHRLDGHPLALELAAARTDVLSLPELADALEVEPPCCAPRWRARARPWWTTLSTGATSASTRPPRGCSPGWASSPGVSGGTRPPTSREMASLPPRCWTSCPRSSPPPWWPAATTGRRTRLRQLQLVQAYAMARLAEAGELEATQRRHAEFYCELAERAASYLTTRNQQRWLAVLDRELGNIGRAITWSSGHDPELALRLSVAIGPWCYLRGRYGLGRGWTQEALAAWPEAPSRLRAAALARAGMLAMLQCDYTPATDLVRRAHTIYLEDENDAGVAETSSWLGNIAREKGDYDEAEVLYRVALGLAVKHQDLHGRAVECSHLSFAFWLQGAWAEGQTWARRSLELARQGGNPEITSWALVNLGAIARHRGELASARLLLSQAFETCEEIAFPEGSAWALNQLGVVSRLLGELGQARAQQTASLEEHRLLGDRWRMASVLDELAAIARAEDDPTSAARLLGCSERLRVEIGTLVPPVEAADRRLTVTATADTLGPAYEAAVLAGCCAGRSTP